MKNEKEKQRGKKRRKLLFVIVFIVFVGLFYSGYSIINRNSLAINKYLPDFLKGNILKAEIIQANSQTIITPTDDGTISINKNNNNISFGFAITGKSEGNNLTYNYRDFNWVVENKSNGFVIYKNDSSGEYKIIVDDKKQFTKIRHELLNKIVTNVDEFKFWYVFEIKNDINIKFNNTYYYPSFEKKISFTNMENLTDIYPTYSGIRIGADYLIDFRDLGFNGFDVTDIYMGNGSALKLGDKLIVAFAVTKKDGKFLTGEKIILDPILTNTGEKFPTATGDPYNQWTNCANIKADDGNLANGSLNQNCSATNFSAILADGGNIPVNSFIQGIQINMDGRGGNAFFGCTQAMIINISLSKDNGVTYTDEKSVTYNCGVHGIIITGSNGLGGSAGDLWGTSWKSSDFANGTFNVRLRTAQVDDGTSVKGGVDYITLEVGWTNGIENNITYSDLSDEVSGKDNLDYHLAISNTTTLLNESNVLVYAPFDFNDTRLDDQLSPYTADFHLSDNEIVVIPSTAPPVLRVGKYGNSYFFNGSAQYSSAGDNQRFDVKRNLTVALWVNRSVVSAAKTIIMHGDVITEDWKMWIPANLNGLSPFIRVTTTNTSGNIVDCSTASKSITNNEWNYTAFTYNGTMVSIYIDGNLQKNCTQSGDLAFTSSGMWGATDNGAELFVGQTDELLILNKALNSTEILNLYNNRLPFIHSRGELVFPNQNIGINNTINISALMFTGNGASFNISIGNKSGSSYVYNPEILFNSTANNEIASLNNINISTPDNTNFSIRFIFYRGGNITSPHLNETFSIKSWNRNACIYTSGNWDEQFENNCVINTNVLMNLGSNLTLTGLGTFTLNANISRCNRVIIDGTQLIINKGARIECWK